MEGKLTYLELKKELAKKYGFRLKTIDVFIQGMIAIMWEHLKQRKKVIIKNLGTFKIVPNTFPKAKIKIRVKFRPSYTYPIYLTKSGFEL